MADLVQIATDVVESCARNDFAGAYVHADKMFSSGVTEFMLGNTWKQILGTAGSFKAVKETRKYRHLLGPLRTVFVASQFERMLIEVEITFNADSKIVGLALLTPGF